MAAACAPVIVVADRPPAIVSPGEDLTLDVHVVSDRRDAIGEARVAARLAWNGGEQRRAWLGPIPADSCVRVGEIHAVVADAPGELFLELELVADGVKATNRYEGHISVR
jgi:beta-mannosidase